MAVVDIYVDSNLEAGKLATAAFSHGDKTVVAIARCTPAVADDNGSVYRLFKNVPADLIPVKFEVFNNAITNGDDWDLGLYETINDGVGGTVIDADVFKAGMNFTTTHSRNTNDPFDGLGDAFGDGMKFTLWEHAGDTQATKKLGYDIALTANAAGDTANSIWLVAWFVQG